MPLKKMKWEKLPHLELAKITPSIKGNIAFIISLETPERSLQWNINKANRELSILEYNKYKKGKWDSKVDHQRSHYIKSQLQQLENRIKKLKIDKKNCSKR